MPTKKTIRTKKKAAARKAPAKKAAARKAPAKKAAARKAPAKKATARKAPAKKATAKKASPQKIIKMKQTQAQIVTDVSATCGHDKKIVKAVLDGLKLQIQRHVRQGGSGEMMLPGIGIKVKRFKKKATKARMGLNPFTGEPIKIKAKPASLGVRARALKALKELAQ